MANGVKFLSSLQTTNIQQDILAQDGTVLIPKGTLVVLLPQTVAAAVVVEGGKSLADLWPTISKTDHVHESYAVALAGYQGELVNLADRTTKVESMLAELVAWATSEHGFEKSQ